MPISSSPDSEVHGREIDRYRPLARGLHWLTVLLLAVQFPVGLYMVQRGPEQNIWDATTNTLYAGHKTVGVIVLAMSVLRLLHRLRLGTPAPVATLSRSQTVASALNHWGMYLLLLVVPILGYLAICYFPALDIVDGIALPAIVAPDRALYDRVIDWHAIGAGTLAVLVAIHVMAALYHHWIRRDDVLARMLPRSGRQRS